MNRWAKASNSTTIRMVRKVSYEKIINLYVQKCMMLTETRLCLTTKGTELTR